MAFFEQSHNVFVKLGADHSPPIGEDYRKAFFRVIKIFDLEKSVFSDLEA